jgi:hypothetical protein
MVKRVVNLGSRNTPFWQPGSKLLAGEIGPRVN